VKTRRLFLDCRIVMLVTWVKGFKFDIVLGEEVLVLAKTVE
jgi:hypothetical protein